jgi:preprotein translocase subunit SecE
MAGEYPKSLWKILLLVLLALVVVLIFLWFQD